MGAVQRSLRNRRAFGLRDAAFARIDGGAVRVEACFASLGIFLIILAQVAVDAIAAASRNPLGLLGVTDRGRLAAGQRADIVQLGEELSVRRVMRAGIWLDGG